MERLHEITSTIITILSDQKKELSIVELSNITGIHRNVLAKYIKVLEAQGKIEISRIGARKYIQLSQKISVSFLKNFIEFPLLIFDSHLQLQDHNEAISQLFLSEHINPELPEAIKKLPEIFLSKDLKELMKKGLQKGKFSKEVVTEHDSIHNYYHLTLIPVVLENGRPGFTLIIENNTQKLSEIKEYNTVIQINKELLKNQLQFIVRLDKNYNIISSNENFTDYVGFDEKTLQDTHFIPAYPKDTNKDALQLLSTINKDNPIVQFEMKRMNAHGDISWERWKISGIFSEESEELHEYLAIGLDITELKRSEEEFLHLKENLEKHILSRTEEIRKINQELQKEIIRREKVEKELNLTKFAMDNAHDYILIMLKNGNLHYFNNHVRELYPNQEKIPKNIQDLIITDDFSIHSEFGKFSPDILLTSGINMIRCSIVDEDNKKIPIELTMSRIDDPDEEIFCCIARDITDRSKVEKDLFYYRKHLETIIDERTKRLQNEIKTRNIIEHAYKKSEERAEIFIDNSYEAVILYDLDSHVFYDFNKKAEILFELNRIYPDKSIVTSFTNIILKNGQNLYNMIHEVVLSKHNEKEKFFHSISVSMKNQNITFDFRFLTVTLDSRHIFRISIIEKL